MNSFLLAATVAIAILAAWYAWRYYKLRRDLEEYAKQIRRENFNTAIKELEHLSSSILSVEAIRQAQRAALESERARLAAVLEQMTDGVLIADEHGVIQFANPAASRLFQIANPVHHSVTEVVRHHQLVEAWQRCRRTGEMQSESVEVPIRRQYLQLFIIPDGYSNGTLLLAQDLTHIRRLEAVRRDFISNLSHELRTPLASLKALTETLQGGALTDPEAGPRFLERIAAEVEALTQMAQELLDLSKIESGQVELVLQNVEPLALLKSTAERMRLQAERAGVDLMVETAASPAVRADAARLEQALVNLIHNAVKFTQRGGSVTLSAKEEGGQVIFSVRDTGIGIPQDDLPRIFERFYRVDKSRAGGGTGLGLSITKHIVESHGGKIWAESEEGKGSTFFFSIPLSA